MGYDIIAYFDVNQTKINNFIETLDTDISELNKRRAIVDYYREQNQVEFDLNICYKYNKKCKIHEFYDCYGTNFIRDDERFTNRRFHQILVEKHNRLFPHCLENINYYLRTDKDAIEVASELEAFFGEDENLMSFVNWLKMTSKYCSIYELSY